MKKEKIQFYAILIITLLLAYLSYFIVKPYLKAILAAAVLAYIFHPAYKFLKKYLKNKTISSLLTCILVILIIILPLFFISTKIVQESLNIYKTNSLEKLENLEDYFGNHSPHFEKAAKGALNYLSETASNFIISIPSKILDFLIAIYTLYFLLIFSENIKEYLTKLLPFKNKTRITNHIKDSLFGITYGIFLIAVIELIITVISFSILKINSAIIWSLVIGFLALIPLIGPALIWIPLAIAYYFIGTPLQTIGIIITGLLLSVIDTFLRPKIIGNKLKTSPVIILIGILGGLKVFGLVGLVIGPIVLTLIIILIECYLTKNEI